MSSADRVGVVLMTYGSPGALSDIPSYLKNVRGGRDPDKELIDEFRRRYKLIGGSPLLRITRAQGSALENELNRSPGRTRYRVVAGMRYAPPFVADVVPEAAEDAHTIVGIIMSPQYSPGIMGGYVSAISQGIRELGRVGLSLRVAREWHLQPYLIGAFGEKVKAGLRGFGRSARGQVHVLMTAHSMPRRIVDKEPGYIKQLKETATAVAREAGIPAGLWSFCYQSAGHTPEEWLKPDFADVLPTLRAAGIRNVMVAPVQFVADHLETLYDLDVGARHQAEAAGMTFARTEALNDSPLFIKALASVVVGTLSEPASIPA
jgi:ferrochelatase